MCSKGRKTRVAQGYDLVINRYKEIVHDEFEDRDPLGIVADIEQLDAENDAELGALKPMLAAR